MKNTFVKVLSFVMALMMVVGTFSTLAVFAEEKCTHEDSTVVADIAATCVSIGYTEYKCNDCGEEYVANVTPMLTTHTLVDAPATDADCENPGMLAGQKCSVEGCTYTTAKVDPTKPAKGHQFVKPYEQKATCTEDGFKTMQCAVCDAIDKDNKTDIVKAAHDLVYTVVTAPTTCTDGSYKITCKNCDYTSTMVEDKDHEWADMPASSDDTKVPLAGEGCKYTYKSGKYCVKCYVVKSDAVKNDEPKHNVAEVTKGVDKNGKLTAAGLNAEISALGFAIGSAVKVEATCTTNGYVLVYCADCEEYFKQVLSANENGHTWGAWEYFAGDKKLEGVTADDDEALTAGDIHTVDKTKVRKCACGASEKSVVVAATAHKYEKEGAIDDKTNKMDCVTNGWTIYTCDLCNEKTEGEVIYATGHNYGEWKLVDGYVCGDTTNAKYRVCTNEHCNVPDGHIEYGDVEKAEHKMVKTTVPATCNANAYYINKCSVCGTEAAYTPTSDSDKPAEGFDKTNHVVKDKNVAAGQFLEKTQTADCVKPEKANYRCVCGELVNVVTKDALGHTWAEGGKWTSADGKTTKDYAETNSTCKTQGQTKGTLCSVCGVDKVVPTKKALDPKNHAGTLTKIGDEVAATCVAKAYQSNYCSDCKAIVNIETSETVAPDAHKLKKVDEVKSTCTTKGTEAYYKCEYCAKMFDKNDDTKKEITAPKTIDYIGAVKDGQHNWGDEVKAVAEECEKDGVKAHKICKDCGYYLIEGVVYNLTDKTDDGKLLKYQAALAIPAHGAKYMGRFDGLNNPDALSCTAGTYIGIPAELICEKCDLPDYWKDKLEHKGEGFTTDAVQNAKTSPDYNCTLPTFTVVTCKCGAKWVKDFTAAPKTAHEFKGTDGKYYPDLLVKGTATCDKAAEDKHYCKYCKQYETTTGDAATGHFIMVGNVKTPISFACSDWATNKGLTCAGCSKTVEKKNVDHSAGEVTYKKDVTCTEDGYHITTCEDCAGVMVDKTTALYDSISVFIPKLNHKNATKVDTVAGKDTFYCPDCKITYTVETLFADLAIVTNANLAAAGTEIKVTLKMTTAGLSFNQMVIALDLAGAFAVESYELVADFGDINVMMDANDSAIYLYTENNADGSAQYAEIAGEDVVVATLTLTTKANAMGKKTITAKDVTIVPDVNADEDKDGDVDTVAVDGKDATADITVATAGNLNGDSMIGVSDVQALITKWNNLAGEYDALVDVNCDGAVDAGDVVALRNFIASAQTTLDYFEMIGVNIVDKAMNHKYLTDVNNDGVKNIDDAIAIAVLVENYFRVYTNYQDYFNGVAAFTVDEYVDKMVRAAANK